MQLAMGRGQLGPRTYIPPLSVADQFPPAVAIVCDVLGSPLGGLVVSAFTNPRGSLCLFFGVLKHHHECPTPLQEALSSL